VRSIHRAPMPPGGTQNIDVDAVGVAGGWKSEREPDPVTMGGRPVWNDQLVAFVPGVSPPGLIPIGGANGHHEPWRNCLAAGAAGARTAGRRGRRLHGELDSAAESRRRTRRHQPDVACRRFHRKKPSSIFRTT